MAINKAWEEFVKLNPPKELAVKFLADEYSVNIIGKQVLSLSCNVPAKEYVAIIILHFLAKKLKGLPALTGEWLPFREFSGIEGYFDAFKKRSIEPILRKYGKNPEAILAGLDKLPVKKAEGGDVGIVVQAFEQVPVLVKLWKADEEFGPDANIYFDRSVTSIFCTEDIVVLAGIVASQL
ncbi:MAG: DUF3786 domain-containing protein [Candidatus Omnitrophica bacterium]|nr:DUF3786 domain-containing protein [Candidatus Omnitrophota bacterium]MBU1869739.1 DUF3786 domain-containing protein [Candidatus Omnitrophota bacterium]